MHAHHDIRFRGDANGDYIKVASNFRERSKDDIKGSPARITVEKYILVAYGAHRFNSYDKRDA
jgi:hypothetical protein